MGHGGGVFAFAAFVEEAFEAEVLVFAHPGVDLLVTDVVGVDGEVIVFAICETVADDLDALFEGGFAAWHCGA